jgi:hypothetical protein
VGDVTFTTEVTCVRLNVIHGLWKRQPAFSTFDVTRQRSVDNHVNAHIGSGRSQLAAFASECLRDGLLVT